jgi:hypothetical protein
MEKEKQLEKYLIPIIQGVQFFQNDKKLQLSEFKFIAEHLKFRFLGRHENVFEYNDYGDEFFIII